MGFLVDGALCLVLVLSEGGGGCGGVMSAMEGLVRLVCETEAFGNGVEDDGHVGVVFGCCRE